tara:strand:- start:977 stop:1345 length:369 start_codon:yes stop_codon:yes gene_type:complete
VAVDAIVTRQNVQTALMTYVTNVIVRRMTIFKHENFVLDIKYAHKSILYKDNKLLFMGDGYKAIQILISQSADPKPVKKKFSAQLNMREKPKFSKAEDELERLRKEALAAIVKTPEKKKKRK